MLADSPTYGENLGTMTIAYSPDVVASAFAEFRVKGFEATLRTQYVSDQYFTNNENDALMLDSYCVTNLDLAYTIRMQSARKVRFGVTIYNIFNKELYIHGKQRANVNIRFCFFWDVEKKEICFRTSLAADNISLQIKGSGFFTLVIRT